MKKFWTQRLQHRDCCYNEVLTMDQAVAHEHNRARDSYLEDNGFVQPSPAPRFVNTGTVKPTMWQRDSDREAILREIGVDANAGAG